VSFPRWLTAAASLALGVALLLLTLRFVSAADVISSMRRMGTGFLLVLAVSGARFLIRAAAWRWCLPEPAELPIGRAFGAVLAGDALGNITPLGPLASEPAKIWILERRLTSSAAMQALVIENVLYTCSVIGLLLLGGGGFLVALHRTVWIWPALALGAVALLAAAAVLARGLPEPFAVKVQGAMAAPRALLRDHPARLALVCSCELLFHVLAIAETFVTLRWLAAGDGTLLQAFLLETVNRFTTVVFKFVPLRLGVDEAGSGLLGAALALGGATGVAMALVRKARTATWVVVGLAWMALTLRGRPGADK
jgi:hypothetical protein